MCVYYLICLVIFLSLYLFCVCIYDFGNNLQFHLFNYFHFLRTAFWNTHIIFRLIWSCPYETYQDFHKCGIRGMWPMVASCLSESLPLVSLFRASPKTFLWPWVKSEFKAFPWRGSLCQILHSFFLNLVWKPLYHFSFFVFVSSPLLFIYQCKLF